MANPPRTKKYYRPTEKGAGMTSAGIAFYRRQNPKAREREIKRTAKLYRQGKLTPAMMERINKQRSKS